MDSERNCEAHCAGEVCESGRLLGGLDGVAGVQPPRAVLTQLRLSPAQRAGATAPASPGQASWPRGTWYRAAQPGWRLLAGRSCSAGGLSTGTAAVWGPSPSTSPGEGQCLRSARHADCQRWFCSLVSAAIPPEHCCISLLCGHHSLLHAAHQDGPRAFQKLSLFSLFIK